MYDRSTHPRHFAVNNRKRAWPIALWVMLHLCGCGTADAPASCETCYDRQKDEAAFGGSRAASTTTTGGRANFDSTAPNRGGSETNSGKLTNLSTGGTSSSSITAYGGSGSDSSAATPDAFTWPKRCSKVLGKDAKSMVEEGALLLDVRSPEEFNSGALPEAANIPLAEIATRMTELDKARPIVVYCHSGSRAAQALTQLCDAGYAVYDLGPEANWSL